MPINKTQVTVAGGAGMAVAGILLQAAQFIAPWEGFYPKPYYDVVHVKTVCYGATAAEHVDLNRTYTKAECEKMLADGLPKYYYGWIACVKPPNGKPLPENMQIAFTSTVYNIGISGFCGSTMAKRVNAGDYKGACHALRMWDKAGGKVWDGLDNRRKAEEALCLKGL